MHPIRNVRKEHLFFYVYRDQSTKREYRWTLYAGNDRKIANSGEGYEHVADCVHAINLVATQTTEIPIKAGPGITLPSS